MRVCVSLQHNKTDNYTDFLADSGCSSGQQSSVCSSEESAALQSGITSEGTAMASWITAGREGWVGKGGEAV